MALSDRFGIRHKNRPRYAKRVFELRSAGWQTAETTKPPRGGLEGSGIGVPTAAVRWGNIVSGQAHYPPIRISESSPTDRPEQGHQRLGKLRNKNRPVYTNRRLCRATDNLRLGGSDTFRADDTGILETGRGLLSTEVLRHGAARTPEGFLGEKGGVVGVGWWSEHET